IAVPNNDAFISNSQNNILNLPPHHLLHWNETSLKYIANKHNLKIVDVYKEKVTNVHKQWYYATSIQTKIKEFLGLEIKTINIGWMNKIINKISTLLLPVFRDSMSHSSTDGHTIAIVFQKVSDA
ncbi:MAG: hypothetical protein JKY55_12340, partial [Aliivibrio sp.]|uniref:hypothetical protein n=1 Tax=Aliivibrio sp. TaxID=1872443 RepID=UPI001A40C596|nr:hypothetical protein [Aliivibrio sp.]